MGALARALLLHRDRSRHGAAALVTEHDEQRRVQMHGRVLQRAHHFRRDDVAGDANDEQLAEAGVERPTQAARASRCSR